MITIAETLPFQRKISILLSSEERFELIAYLAEHPSSGALMKGTGGIRKLRWARQGSGKVEAFASFTTFSMKACHCISWPPLGKMKRQIFLRKKSCCWQRRLKNLWCSGGKEMSKAFTEISEGIKDAVSHAKGEKSGVVEHVPETLNVKAIREKTGMSQQSFCATFGISLGTLRHWEQGLRTPHGAARVLLKVVAQNPQAVINAIHE